MSAVPDRAMTQAIDTRRRAYPLVPVQYAYLVKDMERAITMWRQRVALGPFFVIPNIRVNDALYRGQPSELEFSVALAQAGDIQIELIVQHSTPASALTDTDSGRFCQLNHIAFMSDFEEDVARYRSMGHEVATEGVALGEMRFCYIDTVEQLGHMTELAPRVRQLSNSTGASVWPPSTGMVRIRSGSCDRAVNS